MVTGLEGDLDRSIGLRPAQAGFQVGGGEGSCDLRAAFREVRPPFEVKRDDGGVGECVSGFHGLLSGHGEVVGADLRHLGRTEIEDGG